MKKILLIGKLNESIKELSAYLDAHFQVQLCSDDAKTVAGMLKVVNPDLVIVSLIGLHYGNAAVFYNLNELPDSIPIITMGTEEEAKPYARFYRSGRFENLVRPVEYGVILDTCFRKLNAEEAGVDEEKEQTVPKHILVVDDDPTTLRSVKAMLDQKYSVAVAVSGAQAMASIGKKKPDLILLDYEMPVCDGRMTMEMIRKEEELKDIPIIFLTGINDKEHILAVLRLKPAAYFLKPVMQEKLLKAIEDVLDGIEALSDQDIEIE